MVESLLVPDDLDGDVMVCLVVQRPDHLSKAALANHLQDLIPVRDVVMYHLVVAAIVIVVAAVQHRACFGVNLARVQAEIPDLRVLFNLLLFIVRHAVPVQFDGLWKKGEEKEGNGY